MKLDDSKFFKDCTLNNGKIFLDAIIIKKKKNVNADLLGKVPCIVLL